MMNAIAEIMQYETTRDPVSGCKWTRKTSVKRARQLKRLGIGVSANTVASYFLFDNVIVPKSTLIERNNFAKKTNACSQHSPNRKKKS